MAEPRLLDPSQNTLEGIGGWLVLPLLGLILTPLRQLRTLVVDILPAFEAGTWEALTSQDSTAYSSWWAPYFIVSAVVAVAMAVWAVLLIVLFLGRKRQLPTVISIFYLAGVLAAAFELISSLMLDAELPELGIGATVATAVAGVVGTSIGSAIWIAYFFRSVRVRNTFVR